MRRIMVGTSCVILAGFALAAAAQEPDNVIKIDSPVFPLKEGHMWVYALGKKEVTITVGNMVIREIVRVRDKPPEKVRCYRLHIVSEDKKLTEVVGVVNEGVYRFEAAGKVIAPPLCFFHFKNPTWECKSESGNVALSGTFTLKWEQVTVPALGKPKQAYKISCPDFKMGEQTMSIDYWFVKDFGLVKQRVKVENHPELVLELKEFQPAK